MVLIALSELSDDHINTTEITDKTAAQALTTALTGTLWSVGTSTASGTQNADISRGSVWDAVNTIQSNWNVYITPRVEISSAGAITGRYLDISPAQGTWRGLRMSVRKNMTDPAVTFNDEEVLTALYGYGGNVDVPQAQGDDQTQELTFANEVWTATDSHPAKPSGQMYLETIYVLAQNSNHVRSIDVAEHMGYSKPSVSRAVGLLKKDGYIQVDEDGHITLTKTGMDVAMKIYERHTILSSMLISLGVSPETAAEDACRLEHAISDESFQAIKHYMENWRK